MRSGSRTGIVHHIGTFLLFAASILLLIATISAPVVHDISMLKVTLTNSTDQRHSSVSFGTLGYCVLDVPPITTDQDWCSGHSLSYDPARIMIAIEKTKFSTATRNTVDGLTRVQVLHPITCGLAFIAFLLALGAGIIGGLLASVVAAITWALTLVVMVTDFVSWGIIKDHVNGDGSGSHAVFGAGMWCVLAAMILLFFASFFTLFSCFSKRMHRHDAAYTETKATPVRARRGRFW